MEKVMGAIDPETRCQHYHSTVDRLAIKFACCQKFYACYDCHEKYGCGQPKAWSKSQFAEKALLCGACGRTFSIETYLKDSQSCPNCHAAFNAKCSTHHHLYFAR